MVAGTAHYRNNLTITIRATMVSALESPVEYYRPAGKEQFPTSKDWNFKATW